MGKFLEGWQQARTAAEAVTAEHDRLGEIATVAIAKVESLLKEDAGELTLRDLTLHSEHGALVVKRKLSPVAGITYDPGAALYKIIEYSGSKGSTEIPAQDAEECAVRLGAYIYSLRS